MSSSTSSSDAMSNSRRMFARILLVIVLGMSVALIGVRFFASANGAGSQSLLGRVLVALDAIPTISAEESDLMMFYGSSMVHAGFSPREFDAVITANGFDMKAFNFGFGGLNPAFQEALSRRIAERFEAEDRRLKLVLIEFNPFQTTETRKRRAVPLEDSYFALLASHRELGQMVLDDPERGLRMAFIRYLRDGISAEMITTFFGGEIFQQPETRTELVEPDDAAERLNDVLGRLGEQFTKEYPDYDGSAWYYPWQGGGTIKSERSDETLAISEEYYDLIRADFRMDQDRLTRIATADIEDLHFDQDLVDAFGRMVANFERIADRVEVVMLPKNTDWIRNPPDALARQAAVIREIEAATGVPVRDFQTIDAVSNDMFGDTTHLNRYHGAVAFSEFIARFYANELD